MTIPAGTTLTCTNADCDCRLTIEEPCPHGDEYHCACGHLLVPEDQATSDDDAPMVTPGA